MTNEKIMQRIMALLAKAEATEFEAEAATYLAKAQELMVQHAIDEADLKPEEREKIVTESVAASSSHADAQLWAVVGESADISVLRYQTRQRSCYGSTTSTYQMHLTGFASDVAFAQMLYASLVLQRESALSRSVKPYYENGRTYNKSFRVAFASRVHQRMRDAKKRTVEDKAPGTALVLASRRDQAKAAQAEQFGKSRKLRVDAGHSHAGYAAGDLAGKNADLSGGRNNVGSNRKALTG